MVIERPRAARKQQGVKGQGSKCSWAICVVAKKQVCPLKLYSGISQMLFHFSKFLIEHYLLLRKITQSFQLHTHTSFRS